MPDYGHLETEELISQAERRLRVVYNEAVQDVSNKLDTYLKDFARKDAQWKKMLADGKISQQDYNDWRVGQIMMGKRWEEMKQTLAQDLHNSNVIARSVVNGYRPDAYAINHNYATFLVEKGSQMDTSYTLYDKQTVERLMRDNPQLLPPPGKRIMDRVNAGKDILWQEDHIQSVTLQAILQGESIGSMADRIARTMGEFDHRDSVRYARTAMTGAQNAGRHDGYARANKMGIPMKQTWIATLDNRTRDTHRILDGQTVEIDEPFEVDGMQIRYPGDPDAPGELIWNCRCTTIAQIQGFERDASNMDLRYDERLGTMSYEDWKYEHQEKPEDRNLSFAQSLPSKPVDSRRNFIETFGESGKVEDWVKYDDRPALEAVGQRIENTIAELQKRYPMRGSIQQYYADNDDVVVCDYSQAYKFLPDGDSDRRLDNLATAQVFMNADQNDINHAVIGFNRRFVRADKTIETNIQRRNELISRGESLYAVCGGIDSAESLAIHEWGHIYTEHMTTAMIHNDPDAHAYWDWYRTLSREDKVNGLSEYAATNRGEFEAECFLEMQYPNPRPLAVKWWEYMERVTGKGY